MSETSTTEPGMEASQALKHRHLLGLETYSADEISLILQTARQFRDVLDRPIKRVPTLRGVTETGNERPISWPGLTLISTSV